MTGSAMAKKKPEERSPKNKERKGSGFKTIGFRVSEDYAAWLEEAARHSAVTVAAFIDRSVRGHAKAEGFSKQAPERIP